MMRPAARSLWPLAATILLLVLADTSRAQIVTLDFEGLPAMTYLSGNPVPSEARLSDHYLSTYGIRFHSTSDYVAVINLGLGHATSGTNGIGGVLANGVLDYSQSAPITFDFFDPAHPSVQATTDFFSVRGDLAGAGNPARIDAFDLNGRLIGSNSQIDVGGQTYSLSLPGIHSVRYSGVQLINGGAGIALDDVRFNRVIPVVGEPGILTLLTGVAFAGMAFRVPRSKSV